MKPNKKREAMLKWLKSQKKAAEYEALITAEHHGATQYVKEQNEKAAMIEEIIEIIEHKISTDEFLSKTFRISLKEIDELKTNEKHEP